MGTLEHRLGIGCRNYMLLNPDRMTMNYTMTDLVRACTTLACVACAHGSDDNGSVCMSWMLWDLHGL